MGSSYSTYFLLDENNVPKPVTLGKYIEYIKDQPFNKHIGCFEQDGVRVSTVFLSINHAVSSSSEPVLFETMIFGGHHDNFQRRYCTYDQAVAGHQHAVNIVKKSLNLQKRKNDNV